MTLSSSSRPELPSGESSYLRTYCTRYWPGLILAYFCALTLGLISSVIASLTGPAIQVLISGNQTATFTLSGLLGPTLGALAEKLPWAGQSLTGKDLMLGIPVALAALSSVKALFYTSQGFLWERTGELISRDLRQDIMDAFLKLNPQIRRSSEGRKTEAGLSSHLTTDIKMTREYFVHFYGGLPRELFQVVIMGGVLVALSPGLFLLFFFLVLPVAGLISRQGRKLRKRAGKALEDYSGLTEWLQQRLLGIETIKHYRTEDTETRKMQELTEKLNTKFLRAARVKARTSPAIEFVAITALAGILMVAFRDIRSGSLTGSVAVSFFTTLAMLSQSASMVGRYFNSNREGSAATGRLLALHRFLISHESQEQGTTRSKETGTPDPKTVVSCKNLTVTHPGSYKPALSRFSYSFRKGTLYCITGPSGAGKSTLFQTLLRLIPPDSGELTFHNKAEESLSTGYMPQQPLLMAESVAHNICYPDQDFDARRVLQALEKTGLKQDILDKGGIEIIPGNAGTGLSGGQIQRVLLSRVFYHDFPLILFDEGTSALDPETEQKVYDILQKLRDEGVCIVMIAHRTSAINIADQIIRLEQGVRTSP